MKTFHLQEVHRVFYSDAIEIPAKGQIAMRFETPIGRSVRLVNVTSHRYDASNALRVELHDDQGTHYSGPFVDFSRVLLASAERGIPLADKGFTLLVKNHFEQGQLWPRMRFEFSVEGG
jgi:hypothetical protein